MRKHTFQIRGERVKFYENGKYAHLPGITKDGIRMLCKRHRIPTGNNVEYKNVYVTYLANEFWLSLSVCARRPIYSDNAEGLLDAPLGIDVGIRRAAILSDGTMYDPPNHNRSKILRNRISKLISIVQRDTRERFKQSIRTKTKYENIPKSKNQLKRIDKMRKTYRDIVNLYQGRYHQISADIVKKNPSFVVLENISVTQLCKHDKFLTDELTQARLGVLIHYIKYKCEKNGIPVILAPKYYPSSQICSNCGNRHKPGKSVVYTCPHCGITIDRDINAARNLLDYGERSIMARI